MSWRDVVEMSVGAPKEPLEGGCGGAVHPSVIAVLRTLWEGGEDRELPIDQAG